MYPHEKSITISPTLFDHSAVQNINGTASHTTGKWQRDRRKAQNGLQAEHPRTSEMRWSAIAAGPAIVVGSFLGMPENVALPCFGSLRPREQEENLAGKSQRRSRQFLKMESGLLRRSISLLPVAANTTGDNVLPALTAASCNGNDMIVRQFTG